jgi:hypothetical protein
LGCANSTSTPPQSATNDEASRAAAPAGSAGSGSAADCPQELVKLMTSQDTSCMVPADVGEKRTADCGAALVKRGWERDSFAEKKMYEQLGAKLVCYHKPT